MRFLAGALGSGRVCDVSELYYCITVDPEIDGCQCGATTFQAAVSKGPTPARLPFLSEVSYLWRRLRMTRAGGLR